MRDHRFTLGTMLAWVAASALVMAWVRSFGSLDYAPVVESHSKVAWGLVLALGVIIERSCGPALRDRRTRQAALALFAVALVSSLYLALAHHYAVYRITYDVPRGLPFPDQWVNASERWVDARRPVAPGMLKLHGEYPLVAFVVGNLVLGGSGLTGLLLGVLSNPEKAVRQAPSPVE